jgi:hypothetical protein
MFTVPCIKIKNINIFIENDTHENNIKKYTVNSLHGALIFNRGIYDSYFKQFLPIFTYVNIFLGFLFMQETLTLVQALGAIIVLIGVYFSSKK